MRIIVNTREIAAEYRLSHWAQIIQERNESGLSIKAYCESIGLHQNVYHYWQRKLREAAIKVRSSADDGVSFAPSYTLTPTTAKNEPGTAIVAQTPVGWALCETAKSEPSQSTIQIDIGKSRVTANANTDHELLTKVCRMLVSLC